MTAPPTTPALDTLRGTIRAALLDLAPVRDETLEGPWTWPGHGELELRYGFFRMLEDLEATEAEIGRLGDARSRGATIVAPTAVAAWDLVGILTPLTEDALDADPGGGEWTIRQALAHVLATQRSYAVYTSWWRDQRITPGGDEPPLPPEDLDGTIPEETAADGSLDEVRRRVHAEIDDAASRLAGIGDAELEMAARWSGQVLTVGFRQGRWSSHMTEHTIQVDKTLVMLDRPPTEVARLIRRIAVAWGRVERQLWPVPAAEGATALAATAATRAATIAASVREAARA